MLSAIFHGPRLLLEAYQRIFRAQERWRKEPRRCHVCGSRSDDGQTVCDECYGQ